MPAVAFLRRAAAPGPVNAPQDNGGISAIYIVGFAIAGVVFLIIALWLGIYLYRKRRAKQRRHQMGTAFLSVREVTKEEESDLQKSTYLQDKAIPRNNMLSQVVLPARALIKTSTEQLKAERNFSIAHHRESITSPKPFSFVLHNSNSPTPTRTSSRERLSIPRNSRALSSRMSRFSVFSSSSSYNESLSSSGEAGRSIRKVRQTFNPVLPDELCISAGEQLMILQSFDDGWCVVGRESGVLMPQPKSLFSGSRASRAMTPTLSGHGVGTTSGGNVELGLVPSWCFLKPVKGLRAERPIRSSSLSVTLPTESSGPDRNDTISWSNF